MEHLKASSNLVVGEERALDGPEGLTPETTTQMGLYTHQRQDDRGQLATRGAELLLPLPHISVLTGCRVFVLAQLYTDTQHLEQFSKRMVPLVETRRVPSLLY